MNLPDGFLLQDNKYRIANTIGQGGFGITYLAVWNTEVKGGLGTMKTDVPVCIKEYFFKDYCYREDDSFKVKIHSRTGVELFDKFKEKLIKEANILSEVHHPHIVNVLEVFEENNTAYIVMEYITGCSLKYMLDCEGTLNENKALKYIHQIGNALCFVHEKNILHLDIKPSNIIIDRDDVVRLIDFGVSKRYDIEQRETTTATLTLSKGFASIEQYDDEGTQSFSPCPDIYSLGATMYNLLTGIIPIESILRVTKDILPPSGYNSNISKKTEKAILKAMELKPADRFQSMKEMLEALDIPPCEQSENLLVERKNPFADNNTGKSVSTPVVLISTQEYEEDRTIVSSTPSQKESTETEKKRMRRKKRKSYQRRILSAIVILLCTLAGYALYTYSTDNNLMNGYFSPHNNDTQEITGKTENVNLVEIDESSGDEQVKNASGIKESVLDKKSDKENNKPVENNGNIKTPELEDPIQQPDMNLAERKEKEFYDFFASAQANFKQEKYKEAEADIHKAMKIKFTDEAMVLNEQIRGKLREERLNYDKLTIFGNNITVVRNRKTNLYGAINSDSVLIIDCIYKSATYIPNGKAFMRRDNLYDTYDNDGALIREGLQSIE